MNLVVVRVDVSSVSTTQLMKVVPSPLSYLRSRRSRVARVVCDGVTQQLSDLQEALPHCLFLLRVLRVSFRRDETPFDS